MNMKTTHNLLDNKEVNYVIVELAKVVELYFNHLGMLLIFGCSHCHVHEPWEKNLIQHRRLDLHMCVLCFRLHPLCSKKRHNFKFVFFCCYVQGLTLVIVEFFVPQHKYCRHNGWAYWLFDHSYKKLLNDKSTFQFLLPFLLFFL
jgi:hypothetical protein